MLKEKKKTVNLLNSVNMSINDTHLIKQTQYILISISGGQDSICVFFIFLQLKKQWKWSFGVVYCNHLWQKNTFFANLLVVQLIYMFKIPIYCAITPNKIFNENQSRYWRYDTFYRISFFYNYKIISTGHTSSDKVETILFQLIRGTSTKSLTSLNFIKYFLSSNNFSKNGKIQAQYLYNYTPFRKIKTHKLFYQNYFFKTFRKKTDNINILPNRRLLIRPLLSLHRFDLKKLLIFWELPIYPDVSNKQTYYHRNRIRKQLLPALRFFFNPQIDIIMLQFGEILIADQIYLDIITNRLKHELQIKNKEIVQLNSSLFYGIPLAIQRKLVKRFLETYSQKQTYFFQIEYVLKRIILKKKFSFSPFFVKSQNFKHNSFSSREFNIDKFDIYQYYCIKYKNQSKKKVSLLNVYLSNRNIYTCFPYKSHLFRRYMHFSKKQFFLWSTDKFFCNFYVCSRATFQIASLSKGQLESRIDFYIYLMVYFFIKQANKTNLQVFKSPIKKKNSFNFIQLAKRHTGAKNKAEFRKKKTLFFPLCYAKRWNRASLGCLQSFCNKFAKPRVFHKKVVNSFLHVYYFQKFQIFFYPEIGILFYFQKKLVVLNN